MPGEDLRAKHPPDASVEEPVELSDLRWEDGLVLLVFWVLAGVVFLQFFTRYVLNDSFGWTEEIARFLLIAVTFMGAVMAVRKEGHIAVEIFYRWMSRPLRRVLQGCIDLLSIVFFGAMAWSGAGLALKTRQSMVSVDLPKSIVYWVVAVSFAAMTLFAIRVAWRHLRSGTSRLIDPEVSAKAGPGAD